jgi:hypothetical protein
MIFRQYKIDDRRVVHSHANTEAGPWESRLYVNGGETATLVCAEHKTEKGAEKWAHKILWNRAARSVETKGTNYET